MLSAISAISFTYPISVTLKNENILIIHQNGISICSPFCSLIIKEILTFSEDEKITTEELLSKVTISKFEDGYIVAVIINKIYIFNINGDLEFKSTDSLNSPSQIYYTISPHKIDNNYYYYMIGYAYNRGLYLKYYKYCPNANGDNCIEKNKLVD